MNMLDDNRAPTPSAALFEALRRMGVSDSEAHIIRAPYRVCPLGAHIDHQLGVVTALALDRGITLAYAPLDTPEIHLASLDFPGEIRFRFDPVAERRVGDWGDYARGAVRALQSFAPLRRGLRGVVAGEYAEMGLSSSAALGLAILRALESVNEIEAAAADNIRLDQRIENEYLGLRNGILDQTAILCSRRGALTVIDCKLFARGADAPAEEPLPPGVRRVALPTNAPPVGVLIAFSGLTRQLVGSDYNRRVAECAEAARALLKAVGRPEAPALLSEISEEEYAEHRAALSGPPARRAEHFFGELRRVREGIERWRAGDLRGFGARVRESGLSSLRNYECGSPPLADLQEILNAQPGVWGARFSGAGFRGSCVAFGEPERLRQISPAVAEAYAARHPEPARNSSFTVCETGDGAQ